MIFQTRTFLLSAVLCAGVAIAPAWGRTESKTELQGQLNEATETLRNMTSPNQQGIPGRVISEAKCIAVVPRLTSAAVGVGGEYGRGVVTCQANGKWSAPAFFTISGGSIGIQLGAERTDLVLLALNEAGMNKFLGDRFELGASAGIVAGQKGAAGSEETWKKDIVSYAYSKGAFVGLDLNGAVVRPDKDAMASLYGPGTTSQQALNKRVPVPQEAQPFVAEAERAENHAQRQG